MCRPTCIVVPAGSASRDVRCRTRVMVAFLQPRAPQTLGTRGTFCGPFQHNGRANPPRGVHRNGRFTPVRD